MTLDQRESTTEPPRDGVAGARMRILVGLEGLALGGCPINALDLARTLRDRGHQVDVFAIDEQVRVSLLPYAERTGFEVVRLPQEAGLPARAAQIRRLARRLGSDVIHVYGPWLAPAASIAAASLGSSAAVVTNWTMENVFYTAETPLIVGTSALRREAEARLPAPVWLLEPPVDLGADRPDPDLAAAFRAERGLADDHLVVVVSRLDSAMKAEGVGHAIDAIDAVARLDGPVDRPVDRPGVRLVVVGDGDAAEGLQVRGDAVNAAAGREVVHFTGLMPDPRAAYAAADVVLGMGGSAIRGLAHGRPVVVLGEEGFARRFDEDSVDHFLDDGFYGRGGPPDPVAHLAGLVRALLDDGDRRRLLGELGLACARERFSLETAASSLERVYADALTRRPHGRRRARVGGAMLLRHTRHVLGRRVRSFRTRRDGGPHEH